MLLTWTHVSRKGGGPQQYLESALYRRGWSWTRWYQECFFRYFISLETKSNISKKLWSSSAAKVNVIEYCKPNGAQWRCNTLTVWLICDMICRCFSRRNKMVTKLKTVLRLSYSAFSVQSSVSGWDCSLCVGETSGYRWAKMLWRAY